MKKKINYYNEGEFKNGILIEQEGKSIIIPENGTKEIQKKGIPILDGWMIKDDSTPLIRKSFCIRLTNTERRLWVKLPYILDQFGMLQGDHRNWEENKLIKSSQGCEYYYICEYSNDPTRDYSVEEFIDEFFIDFHTWEWCRENDKLKRLYLDSLPEEKKAWFNYMFFI